LIFGVLSKAQATFSIDSFELTERFLLISTAPIPKWDQHSLLLGAALSNARPELDVR
jgi:hypothetical protein